ncbi:MAG: PD40 domain-containing protein [Acidobacteria bacterium]|nr:PD40 domain-containing protein [Acidobacteriota bacterium]
MRRIDLETVDGSGLFEAIEPFSPATRKDIPGPFSPDGSKVAFTSTRGSADYELWVADASGAHGRQLTFFGSNSLMMAHSWSPDSRQILFEAAVEGNSDLYVISADGGKAARLTTSPAIEGLADWSRDGRWIYYTKIGSGMDGEIWRVPAQGGPAQRITNTPGNEPKESPDGQSIYCVDRPPLGGVSGRLMRIPAGGGEAKKVLDEISPFYWSVTDQGIYFVREDRQVQSIYLYGFAGEKIRRAGRLPFRVAHFPRGPGRLIVSRNGRWALVSVTDRWEGDLMLLDNFR